MDLIARVRAFIRQHDLIPADARVVAAVSGGSDSIALLHVLHGLAHAGLLRLAGVAHFNHQLRAAADDDERFVAEGARARGLPFVADREDIRARASRDGRSIEDAARAGRHEFFERARVALGADLVAVGHTLDDQAETFLLRLVRGAGPRGLAGMHPRNGTIVRPLLGVRRAELRTWLAENGTRTADSVPAYIEDETNDDPTIARNRVRAELVPLLTERFNPRMVEVLADEAALQQELWAWMEDASAPLLATPGELDIAALQQLPLALQRVVVWRAMSLASGGRPIAYDHVAAALRLMRADRTAAPGGIDAPGHRVQRIGGRIVLKTTTRAAALASPVNLFRYTLSIPGEVRVPEARCRLSAEEVETMAPRGCAAMSSGGLACIRRDLVPGSLAVRNRRPADRFRPLGLGGSKKLQDLFVDAKLPRSERDTVPVVVDESDRIVWVTGHGIDEAFRVTDASQAVLILRLTRD